MNRFWWIAIAAIGTSIVAVNPVQAEDCMCASYGDDTKVPCRVWVDGDEIAVGGFQAAPVFTMLSRRKAIDHRGNSVTVTHGSDYTIFYDTVYKSTLRIYDFKY